MKPLDEYLRDSYFEDDFEDKQECQTLHNDDDEKPVDGVNDLDFD